MAEITKMLDFDSVFKYTDDDLIKSIGIKVKLYPKALPVSAEEHSKIHDVIYETVYKVLKEKKLIPSQ